jgi:putative mycofactocin binding protein MftB
VASTETPELLMTIADAMLDEAWALSPSVSLRPEPFGALAYHFGNRRLTFLKKPELVAVVRALGESLTVRGALEQAFVPESQWSAYLTALRGLVASDMLHPIEGTTP